MSGDRCPALQDASPREESAGLFRLPTAIECFQNTHPADLSSLGDSDQWILTYLESLCPRSTTWGSAWRMILGTSTATMNPVPKSPWSCPGLLQRGRGSESDAVLGNASSIPIPLFNVARAG